MIIDREEIVNVLDLYREGGDLDAKIAATIAIEELVSRSYAEGYSFAKKESDLVEKAAESLSD